MSTQTLVGADWYDDLRAWLEPFLAALGRSEQRSGRRCTVSVPATHLPS